MSDGSHCAYCLWCCLLVWLSEDLLTAQGGEKSVKVVLILKKSIWKRRRCCCTQLWFSMPCAALCHCIWEEFGRAMVSLYCPVFRIENGWVRSKKWTFSLLWSYRVLLNFLGLFCSFVTEVRFPWSHWVAFAMLLRLPVRWNKYKYQTELERKASWYYRMKNHLAWDLASVWVCTRALVYISVSVGYKADFGISLAFTTHKSAHFLNGLLVYVYLQSVLAQWVWRKCLSGIRFVLVSSVGV